jgi:KaiC/GvpD/RAD55 family RecA-like ATPase
LGGGLFPGTLTVVVGATGIGKTQLGLQFANAGLDHEKHRGVVFDMTARGDSQSHAEYARRMFHWEMEAIAGDRQLDLTNFFDSPRMAITSMCSTIEAGG